MPGSGITDSSISEYLPVCVAVEALVSESVNFSFSRPFVAYCECDNSYIKMTGIHVHVYMHRTIVPALRLGSKRLIQISLYGRSKAGMSLRDNACYL